MNTEMRVFKTADGRMYLGDTAFNIPPGQIRISGDSIIYRIYHNVQWVLKNLGKVDENWYKQIESAPYEIEECSLSEREIEKFKSVIEKWDQSDLDRQLWINLFIIFYELNKII